MQGYKIAGVLNPDDFDSSWGNVNLELEPLDESSSICLDYYKGHFYEVSKDGKYIPPKSDICTLNLADENVRRIHHKPPHITVNLKKIEDLKDAIPFIQETLHNANVSYTEFERQRAERQAEADAEHERQLNILREVDRQLRFNE